MVAKSLVVLAWALWAWWAVEDRQEWVPLWVAVVLAVLTVACMAALMMEAWKEQEKSDGAPR